MKKLKTDHPKKLEKAIVRYQEAKIELEKEKFLYHATVIKINAPTLYATKSSH